MLGYIGLSLSNVTCSGLWVHSRGRVLHFCGGALLVVVGLWRHHPLELHKLAALKALADGPLQYATVDGNGDKRLRFAFSHGAFLYHPADLPHRSGVLVEGISGAGEEAFDIITIKVMSTYYLITV